MVQHVIPTGVPLLPESLHFDEPGNTVWACGRNGAVVTVRLLDRQVTQLGLGYRRPVAALPGHDGLTVAVVERRGRIWQARRDHANRGDARLVAVLPGRVLAARRHPDPGLILVLTTGALDGEDPGPSLVACDLADGTLVTLASEIEDADSFAVDDARREIVVLAKPAAGDRELSWLDVDDGSLTGTVSVADPIHTLTTSPDTGEHGVAAAFADAASPGRVTLVRADGTTGASLDLGRPVKALAHWGSLLLAASGQDIVASEWNLLEGALEITRPLAPLYVNGYATLHVDLAGAGLTLADVTFQVAEGPDAGVVSAGIEPPADDGTQPIRLVAGFLPGEYHLVVTRNSDGAELAALRFRVTALWPDELVGPPVTVTAEHRTFRLMSWGGAGASGDYLNPAPEEFRILVVLVAARDRRWGGTEVAARDQWKDRVLGEGGLLEYYEEVSYFGTPGPPTHKGMTVKLLGDQVFGPVDLAEGWGDLFKIRKPGDVNGGWTTLTTGKEALANAISAHMADQPDGHLLMQLADSVAIVVRSGSDAPTPMGTAPPLPTRYVWGHASRTDFWRKTGPPQGPTTFTQGPKPITVMTDRHPAGLANPPDQTGTLIHEAGHNLGLADLYDAKGDFPAEINARLPKWCDIMATHKTKPHFSLGNRIRLGWIDRAWLRRFDFSASPTGGSVTLQATETLTRDGPPAGRHAGIEVPIKTGWSYLYELRREQAGQVGDQRLEVVEGSTEFVLGTDLRVSGAESARPPVLFLPEDADGDGPILDTAGENYRDSDVTNPQRMHDFTLTLDQLGAPDANSARVDVTYEAAHRPQLQIRSAPGKGNFRSPDIELQGPFGLAVSGAVKGATNAIGITVHNLGTLQATDVQIHVKWLPFTVSAGDWRELPDPAPFTVPAVGKTQLMVAWPVPESVKVGDREAEHFCVRVEIERYRDPAHPEAEEIVVFDNWAQSNFDAVSLKFGSPSERVSTVATAGNPLARTATYQFAADQSTPWYRVYVGNAWLRLPPGANRAFDLAYESLAGDPVAGEEFERNLERITSQYSHAAVTSWLVPENTECDTPREWWGVALDLRAGRHSAIDDVRRNGELVTCRVTGTVDGRRQPVDGGQLHLAVWPIDEPDRVSHTEGTVRDGEGRVLLSNETLHDLANGRTIIATLARPADTWAQVVTPPQPLP